MQIQCFWQEVRLTNFFLSYRTSNLKVYLFSIRFSSASARVFFSMKKYVIFRPHFCMSIPELTKLSHSGQKFSEKKKKSVCIGIQPYFEISLSWFMHKIFVNIRYVTV